MALCMWKSSEGSNKLKQEIKKTEEKKKEKKLTLRAVRKTVRSCFELHILIDYNSMYLHSESSTTVRFKCESHHPPFHVLVDQ
jgi:hypothetical protein